MEGVGDEDNMGRTGMRMKVRMVLEMRMKTEIKMGMVLEMKIGMDGDEDGD